MSAAGTVAHFDSLPNGMLEFQIRLTPKEYELLNVKRRHLEAEGRYKARMAQAYEKHAAAAAQRGGDPSLHVPGTPFSSFPQQLGASSGSVSVLREPYSASTAQRGDAVLFRSSGGSSGSGHSPTGKGRH